MIVEGTRFAVRRLPLNRIVIPTVEKRYPRRMLEYHQRLTDAQRPTDDVLIHVKPLDAGYYGVIDGRHRFIAALLAGRATIWAVIVCEPGQPGYDSGPSSL